MAYLKHRKHGTVFILTPALLQHPDLYEITDNEAHSILGGALRSGGVGVAEEPAGEANRPRIEKYSPRWYRVVFSDGSEISKLTKEEAEEAAK